MQITKLARVALLASIGLSSLQAQVTIHTVVNNGPPSELYDIVILGDGYRAAEEARFDQDVLDVVNYFRNDPRKFPYGAYFQGYNVHTVFRASNESGADDPNAGIFRDTAYDASYNTGGTQRCLYIGDQALATQDAARAPDTDGRVIVLVNDSQYGGCAGAFSVSYNGSSMEDVQAHEWGHSFGGLADEYDYGASGTYTGSELREPNVTNDSSGSKWSVWLGHAGPHSTVSAYEGARYYRLGIWRPETDCEMRSLNRNFCTICRQAMILRFNQNVAMLGSPMPATTQVIIPSSGSQTFSFVDRLGARPHTITWTYDGQTLATSVTQVTLSQAQMANPPHQLTVQLVDTSTEVRQDPQNHMVHERTWQVIDAPCFAGNVPYGVGCPGSNGVPPLMVTAGTPSIPSPAYTLLMLGGLPNAPVVLGLSLDNQLFGGALPLPVDLTSAGAPGCNLWASWDLPLPFLTNANGIASWTVSVPNDPALNHAKLFFQWLGIDPAANALGLSFSSAVEVRFCL